MQGQRRGCRAPCAIGVHHSGAHSEKKAKCVLLHGMGVQHSPDRSLLCMQPLAIALCHPCTERRLLFPAAGIAFPYPESAAIP